MNVGTTHAQPHLCRAWFLRNRRERHGQRFAAGDRGTGNATATIAAAANAVGVWVDGGGNEITSATVGQTVTLQLCTTESTINALPGLRRIRRCARGWRGWARI